MKRRDFLSLGIAAAAIPILPTLTKAAQITSHPTKKGWIMLSRWTKHRYLAHPKQFFHVNMIGDELIASNSPIVFQSESFKDVLVGIEKMVMKNSSKLGTSFSTYPNREDLYDITVYYHHKNLRSQHPGSPYFEANCIAIQEFRMCRPILSHSDFPITIGYNTA